MKRTLDEILYDANFRIGVPHMDRAIEQYVKPFYPNIDSMYKEIEPMNREEFKKLSQSWKDFWSTMYSLKVRMMYEANVNNDLVQARAVVSQIRNDDVRKHFSNGMEIVWLNMSDDERNTVLSRFANSTTAPPLASVRVANATKNVDVSSFK